jgi:DNA (cytosine-5)-methyltransferase 1
MFVVAKLHANSHTKICYNTHIVGVLMQSSSKVSSPTEDLSRMKKNNENTKPMPIIDSNANGIRVVSLFSGAGGLDLGFLRAGYSVIWANDFDKNACDTYRRNLGDHIRQGSILDIDPKTIPSCDLIIGGPPCQGFSTIGKRSSSDPKKRAAHDPRNELVLTYAKIIRTVRPKFIVMENVKGILTRNGGSYLNTVLSELRDAGYAVDYRLVNMADYGVPQIRERIIVLGNRVGVPVQFPNPDHAEKPEEGRLPWVSCGEVLSDLADRADDPAFNHVALRHTPTNIARYRMIPEGGRLPEGALPATLYRKNFGNTFKRLHHAKPSLTMVPGNDAFPIHPTLDRSLTVREAARIQTFPDEMIFCGNRRQQGHQVGNAVPPLFAEKLARFLKKEMQKAKGRS